MVAVRALPSNPLTSLSTSAPAPSAPAAVGTLYLWSNSPFGYKVLMAAAHKGLHLDTRVASLPDCGRAQQRTGLRKVPFLVAGDRWITDSTSICEWLEAQGGPSLLPAEAGARAECKLLEDWSDEGLNKSAEPWIWMGDGRFPRVHDFVVADQVHRPSAWMFRLLGFVMRRVWQGRVDRHGGLKANHALLCAQLDLVEARLAGRPWLFGDTPTIADFAIAGQLANLLRFRGSEDLDQRPVTAAMVRRACTLLPPTGDAWNGR